MAHAPHATVGELHEFMPDDVDMPDDAERRLRRASELIDDYVFGSYEISSTDGKATDPRIAEALSLATCAQVVFALETGDEQGVDDFHMVAAGSLTLARSETKSRRRLAPHAETILRGAGLTAVST